MPDFNWEYRPLRQEIYKMLRWWLDLGVDGFRLDVFTRLKKPAGFPDTAKAADVLLDRNGFVMDTSMCTNVEGIHEILQEMHAEVFGPIGCMTVGEGAGVTAENALDYIHPDRREVDMVYHFELSNRKSFSLEPEKFRRVQKRWAQVARSGGWPVQYLSNHDSARQVSCYGEDGPYRIASAKLLATLIHTTPGTPFIYQGEEIGMVNVTFDRIEDYNCRYTVGDYWSMIEMGSKPEQALKILAPRSRDNARTPYQWNAEKYSGFTEGTPWIKINPRYTEINLEADRSDPDSIFGYYQKLIAMRREHPAILDGDLEFLLEDHPQVIMYLRRCTQETLLVIANLSGETPEVELPRQVREHQWRRILTNREETLPSLDSRACWLPWEAEVYTLIR